MARLGDFRKLLATKFLAKEAQMIGKFLGYFEKPYSYVKLHWLLLGQLLEKIGPLLLLHLVTLIIIAICDTIIIK